MKYIHSTNNTKGLCLLFDHLPIPIPFHFTRLRLLVYEKKLVLVDVIENK